LLLIFIATPLPCEQDTVQRGVQWVRVVRRGDVIGRMLYERLYHLNELVQWHDGLSNGSGSERNHFLGMSEMQSGTDGVTYLWEPEKLQVKLA
jgi:hypothetical protein